MLARIKSVTDQNSWYSEAINNVFYVFEIPGTPYYWACFEYAIYKHDVEIISQHSGQKRPQKKAAIN